MTLLFVILIIIAAFILGLIVLIQNPKGGGLAGNIAGFSTQFMGVKQTTDVLEKGTWIFAGVIGILCLFSTFFIDINGAPASSGEGPSTNPVNAPNPTTGQPKPGGNVAPFTPTPQPVTGDSNK
jgi:preprotein translocase subunit SecG